MIANLHEWKTWYPLRPCGDARQVANRVNPSVFHPRPTSDLTPAPPATVVGYLTALLLLGNCANSISLTPLRRHLRAVAFKRRVRLHRHIVACTSLAPLVIGAQARSMLWSRAAMVPISSHSKHQPSYCNLLVVTCCRGITMSAAHSTVVPRH